MSIKKMRGGLEYEYSVEDTLERLRELSTYCTKARRCLHGNYLKLPMRLKGQTSEILDSLRTAHESVSELIKNVRDGGEFEMEDFKDV